MIMVMEKKKVNKLKIHFLKFYENSIYKILNMKTKTFRNSYKVGFFFAFVLTSFFFFFLHKLIKVFANLLVAFFCIDFFLLFTLKFKIGIWYRMLYGYGRYIHTYFIIYGYCKTSWHYYWLINVHN